MFVFIIVSWWMRHNPCKSTSVRPGNSKQVSSVISCARLLCTGFHLNASLAKTSALCKTVNYILAKILHLLTWRDTFLWYLANSAITSPSLQWLVFVFDVVGGRLHIDVIESVCTVKPEFVLDNYELTDDSWDGYCAALRAMYALLKAAGWDWLSLLYVCQLGIM